MGETVALATSGLTCDLFVNLFTIIYLATQ